MVEGGVVVLPKEGILVGWLLEDWMEYWWSGRSVGPGEREDVAWWP